jgi:hypothetical protein
MNSAVQEQERLKAFLFVNYGRLKANRLSLNHYVQPLNGTSARNIRAADSSPRAFRFSAAL